MASNALIIPTELFETILKVASKKIAVALSIIERFTLTDFVLWGCGVVAVVIFLWVLWTEVIPTIRRGYDGLVELYWYATNWLRDTITASQRSFHNMAGKLRRRDVGKVVLIIAIVLAETIVTWALLMRSRSQEIPSFRDCILAYKFRNSPHVKVPPACYRYWLNQQDMKPKQNKP